MPQLLIHRIGMAHPGDLSQAAALFDSGALAPGELRAVIGKTEGNGGLNDFTRGYFTQSLMALLAARTGEDAAALAARIPCVLSGGCEGALSPHAMVFGVREGDAPGEGLAIGTGFSAPTPAGEIGSAAQIAAVAETLRAAMRQAGIARAEDVALVQVKAPATTPPGQNPGVTMARSRAAAAFGVALALGEIAPEAARPEAMLRDVTLYSPRASISSGIEMTCNEVVVFGRARGWADGIALGLAPMQDLLDTGGIARAFAAAGLGATPPHPRLLGVIAKGEPAREGQIRGHRHTMLGDTDLDAQRHLRAALGALVAAAAGDGRVFVSGGAEHQGPPGGGLVAVFAQRPPAHDA
jgi:cyanuric acid amidohydrolase